MKENGTPESNAEKFILSRINIRPDYRIAELVEDGLIRKEEAMEYLADIPKIIESPESMKIFYFYTFCSQFGDEFDSSCELFKKYPNQVRMSNIDDADIFAFVCSKRKDEYWIHQDVKQLLDYAKCKNKMLLPIISDFSLGYEIITISDFDTDLSFKIFDIDDQEPEEPEKHEPETIKYGEDIEMKTYSSIPFDPRGDYELSNGPEIISGKMDKRRVSFGARVSSILSVDKQIRSYAAENYYKDYIIFQVWANKTEFRIQDSNERKYHVIVIVRKDNVYTDYYKKSVGELKLDQKVSICGTISSWPVEGCKVGFVYGKDHMLKLPAVFADRVEIVNNIDIGEEGKENFTCGEDEMTF